MNLAAKLGLGVVALGAIGVGGFFAFDQHVHSSIEQSFANISVTNPVIRSASYEGLHVDYLANTVRFESSRIAFDAEALMNMQNFPQNASAEGTLVQEHGTITVFGLWDLVFGARFIPRLQISSGAFDGNMTLTTALPSPPDGDTQKRVIHQKIALKGTFGETSVEGLGWEKPDQNAANSINPLGVSAARFDSRDFDIDMALSIDIPNPGHDDGATGLQQLNQVGLTYKVNIDRVTGAGLHKDGIKSMRYEDMELEMDMPAPMNTSINATADVFGIEDLLYVGMVPVKMSYFVEGFTLPPEIVTAPQVKSLMAAFGITELNFDFKVAYDYNEKDRSLSVSPLSFGAKQAGKIDVAFELTGVPGLEFIDQLEELNALQRTSSADALVIQERADQMMQKALKTLSISQLRLGYEDLGVLKTFLSMQADQSNTDLAGIAEAFSNQGAMIVMQTHGEAVAEDAQKKLASFLADPDTIRIQLNADKPVRIEDLMKDFEMFGPQALANFNLDIHTSDSVQPH